MPDSTHEPDNAQRIQLPPIGPEPDAAQLLLCATFRSSDRAVVNLAALVFADDLDPPASLIYSAAIALAHRRVAPSPAFVLDELRRTGQWTDQVQRYLYAAVTARAERMLLREYAAVVVHQRLRALVESMGHALACGAESVPESALPDLAERAAKAIRTVADRLDALRGES